MTSMTSAQKTFWSWFVVHAKELHKVQFMALEFKNPPSEVSVAMGGLKEQLSKVHPLLEVGITEHHKDGIKEIVFSANGRMELVPVVLGLVNHAPEIDGWKCTAFKPRMSSVNSIRINNTRLSLSDISFSLDVSDNHTVKLDLYVKGPLTDQVAQGVYLLLQATIGERELLTKVENVNLIEITPRERRLKSGNRLGSLPVILDAI